MKLTLKERIIIFLISLIDFFAKLFPLKKMIVFESSPDFADNTYFVYKKLLERGYNKKYKFVWVLNGEKTDMPLPKNVSAIVRKSGSIADKVKARWIINRSKYIIDCNRYLYKVNDKQVRVHLKHGLPIKDAHDYNHSIGEVDFISVPAEYWLTESAKEHGLDGKYFKAFGFARNDVLIPAPHENESIIWMPTFRTNKNADPAYWSKIKEEFDEILPFGLPFITDVKNFEEINELFRKNNAYLYIRLHPAQDTSKINLSEYSNILLCNDDFLRKQGKTLYEFLCYTDGLVTDYSSIYYDYLILDKPIALTPSDFDTYVKYNGIVVSEYNEFKKTYPGYYAESYEQLLSFFTSVFEDRDESKEERTKAKEKYMGAQTNNSAGMIVDYMAEHYGL